MVPTTTPSACETEIGPPARFSLGLGELLRYQELFYYFTWRDIKVRYKQTVFGVAWSVLQPLLMMVVFTLFLGRVLRDSTPLPYPLYAFSGLVLWGVFSGGLNTAGNSMISNANIIRKIYFPRLILPVSAVLVALFDFLMGIPVLAGLALWYGEPPGLRALWCVPASVLLAFVATVGVGSLLAALTIKYRDFRYVLPFLIQLLLFLTPVIYPPGFVTQRWLQYALALNPMSGAVNLFHGMFPQQPVDALLCGISCLSAAVWFAAGLWYFRRTEAYFADLA